MIPLELILLSVSSEKVIDGGIPLTLGISLLIFFICFSASQFARPRYPWYFYPRIWDKDEEKPFWFSFENLAWLWRTLRASKEEVGIRAGMYGLLYIRFLLFMAVYIVFMGCIALPVLIPLNVVGKTSLKGFTATTATNIPKGSTFLIAHVLLTVLFVLLGLLIIWWYQRIYFITRKEFRNRDFVNSHAVKIRNIPKRVKEGELRAFFENIFPGEVISVSIPPIAPQLITLKMQKAETLQQLAASEYQFQESGNRPLVSPGCCGFLATKTGLRAKEDAMSYQKAKIVDLSAQIQRRQKFEYASTGCAFVTFATAERAHYVMRDFYIRSNRKKIVASCDSELKKLLKPQNWSVQPASRPQEVFWENLSTSSVSKVIRRVIFSIGVVLLAAAWSLPISFLASVTTLKHIPGLGLVVGAVVEFNPFFRDIIEGYIPSLCTTVIVLILPPILTILVAKFEKPDTISERDASVLRHYYVFLMLNVLIFQTLLIGTLDSISNIFTQGFGEILADINFSLQGAYYINYVLQQAFFTGGIRIVRIQHWFALFKRLFAVTDEQKEVAKLNASVNNEFEYRVRFAQASLIMGIVLTFAVVVPLILPAGFLFFASIYVIDKNNIIHVYHKIIVGDGSLIISVVNMFVVALLICCGLTSVFFYFKEVIWAFIIMMVLIGFTLACMVVLNFLHWYNMYRYIKYGKPNLIEWNLPHSLLESAYVYPGLVEEEENLNAALDKYISDGGDINELLKSENDRANDQFMKQETCAFPVPHLQDQSSSDPLEDEYDDREQEMEEHV